MTQVGVITKVIDDMAEVSVVRGTACGETCKGCSGHCALTKNTVMAKNIINADVGDVVSISSKTEQVIKMAFLVYILPIILFFFTYFSAGLFFENESLLIALSLAVFFLVFCVLHILDKKNKTKVEVEITKILKKKGN